MKDLFEAVLLQAGYNAALVAIGAALLGFAAGAVGSFLFLRKRALVSDAMAHATLPGICIAFMVMVALGGSGRSLPGLLAGSVLTAGLGVLAIDWITRRTRLAEDAAIGAVLSVFFGAGVVLLTIIQTMSAGRQAGLEGFLLGSTAGMLFQDAVLIAAGGAVAVAIAWMLRRPMILMAFDPEFAVASGFSQRCIDLLLMGLVMAVTVIGLKLVGLVLIVALLIIPPVTARFWTDRAEQVVWLAGGIGAFSAYAGATLSAALPAMPTGPVIVLICAALFFLSLILAPGRGLARALWRGRRFRQRVALRRGLLALAADMPLTNELAAALRAAGLTAASGQLTARGQGALAELRQDEARWDMARATGADPSRLARYDGMIAADAVFSPGEIEDLDTMIAGGAR